MLRNKDGVFSLDIKIDNKNFYRNLWHIAMPIALQSLMLAMVAAADALMLGRVTQEQMTAVSLATQVQFVQNMFIFSSTTAGAILGAQYWGKGDKKALQNIFNLMLVSSEIVCIVFFLMCEFIPGRLMQIFAADPQLIAIGTSYLKIAGWSYLLVGISQSYLSIMKVTENVKEGAFISSGAVIVNILLNAVFIFGLLGMPRMEARGAALATTISRVIELTCCIVISLKPSYVRPALSRLFAIPLDLTRDFMRQYLPLLGGSLCWGIGFTSYTAIMGHLGVDAAAANSIAAVVRDLICCMCNGVGSAAGIIVGNELGAGKLDVGKAYGIKLKNISYVIGFISTALVLLVTPFVVNGVILTDTARKYLVGMMIIMSIYMIGRAVNTVTINGVLDGGGDTLFDMYSLIVTMWCIAIPLALAGAFVFHWSPLLVYACTCLDEVGKIPWVMYRFRKYKWVKDLTR